MPMNNLNLSKQFAEAKGRGRLETQQSIANFIKTSLKQIIKGCEDDNLKNITAYNETGIATVDIFSSLPNRSQEKIGRLTLILIEKNSQESAECSTAVLFALVKEELSFNKLTEEDIAFAVAEEKLRSALSEKDKLLNAFGRLTNRICSFYTEALRSTINTLTDMPLLLRWLPNYTTHQKETSKYTEIFNAMSALLRDRNSQTNYQTLVKANAEWSKNKPYFDDGSSFIYFLQGLTCIALPTFIFSFSALASGILLSSVFIIPMIIFIVSVVVGLVAGLSLMYTTWANSFQQMIPRLELEAAIEEAKQFQKLLQDDPNNGRGAPPSNANPLVNQPPIYPPLLQIPMSQLEPGQKNETPFNANSY